MQFDRNCFDKAIDIAINFRDLMDDLMDTTKTINQMDPK